LRGLGGGGVPEAALAGLFDDEGAGGVVDALYGDGSVLFDLDIAEPEVLDEVAVGLAAGDEERADGGRLSAGPTLETANDADVEEARNQAQSDAVGGDGR